MQAGASGPHFPTLEEKAPGPLSADLKPNGEGMGQGEGPPLSNVTVKTARDPTVHTKASQLSVLKQRAQINGASPWADPRSQGPAVLSSVRAEGAPRGNRVRTFPSGVRTQTGLPNCG